MELYNKILIHNEKEAQSFIDSWNRQKVSHYLEVKDFERYPALLCYGEDETDYSMSYASRGYWSITYLDDFEEYTGMNLDVAKIYNFIKKERKNPYYDDNAYLERINGYDDILKFIEENKLIEENK